MLLLLSDQFFIQFFWHLHILFSFLILWLCFCCWFWIWFLSLFWLWLWFRIYFGFLISFLLDWLSRGRYFNIPDFDLLKWIWVIHGFSGILTRY